MAVMQKFRNRFRRPSSTNVTDIYIEPEICARKEQSTEVLKRNPALAYVGDRANLDYDRLLSGEILSVKPICNLNMKTKEIIDFDDNFLLSLKKECEALRADKENLEQKLNESVIKLEERDKAIKELRISVRQMQQQRLNENGDVKCQRSLQLNRPCIHVEAELEKLKQEFTQQNVDAGRKVQKAKKKMIKLKQDFALKLFELKEENARLKENSSKTHFHSDSMRTSEATDDSSSSQIMKNGLVVQLSKQISHLLDENLKLKDDLSEARKRLSNFMDQNR